MCQMYTKEKKKEKKKRQKKKFRYRGRSPLIVPDIIKTARGLSKFLKRNTTTIGQRGLFSGPVKEKVAQRQSVLDVKFEQFILYAKNTFFVRT